MLCAGFLTQCLMHARCHSVYNATSLALYLHCPTCQREWVFPFFHLLFPVLPLLLEEPGGEALNLSENAFGLYQPLRVYGQEAKGM